jgi:hypothetical protein
LTSIGNRVWATPARLASSRFEEDEHGNFFVVESRPIRETKDRFLYFCVPGREYMTVEEAKAAADAEPWGPVKWD